MDTRIALELELMETYAEALGKPQFDKEVLDMALQMSERLEEVIVKPFKEDPKKLFK